MKKNKKVKRGSFLEISGVYFWTLILAFAAAFKLDDGTDLAALWAIIMVVFLPIFAAFAYWIHPKRGIVKRIAKKVSDFNGADLYDVQPDIPDIEEEIQADKSADSEEPNVAPIEASENRIQQIQEMNRLQEHRRKLQKYKEEIISKKLDFDRDIKEREDRAKAMESALRETEFTVLDWVSRMEKKDQAVFDEILRDASKLKENQIQINGYEFEEYVAKLLRLNGYENVEVTQKSNDYGADVLAEKAGIRYVFQCKYYTSMVGISAVQQIYSAKDYYNAHIAVVVTNNVFTKAAKKLAKELKVILWDCEMVNKLSEPERDVKNVEKENCQIKS